MKTPIFALLLILCTAAPVMAGEKTITYYLDGAKVEYEAASGNRYFEFDLPKGFISDSVRIKPLGGASIERVEITRAKADPKTGKERSVLAERKNQLVDRLKALDTREEIFKTAAKSQSGRAPRKTKNNPQPVSNIRQGTEFAISQLESVYTLRRKTEKELAFLESKLSSLGGATGPDASLCRVWLSGNNGRVRISYFVSDWNWKPTYEFRANGDGRVQMTMRAVFTSPDKNCSVLVAPCKISGAGGSSSAPRPVSKPSGKVAEYTLQVQKEVLSDGPDDSVSLTFHNPSEQHFPAGEAAYYRNGEYIGHTVFQGVGPKESAALTFGRFAGQ